MIRSLLRRCTLGRWPEVRHGERLTCPEVARRLQRYLDGEIADEAVVDALAAHLDECARCGHEAETYRAIKASLARRRQPVPPESVARLRDFGERLVDGR
jgi:predicted anti-sigma-YlaC factor YlaD